MGSWDLTAFGNWGPLWKIRMNNADSNANYVCAMAVIRGGGGGGGGGGALGQVSYGGVQLRGPNPYPILGKAGLRKHTLS